MRLCGVDLTDAELVEIFEARQQLYDGLPPSEKVAFRLAYENNDPDMFFQILLRGVHGIHEDTHDRISVTPASGIH